jgi:DNA-directed RNA polymerase subunit RPC12/RpoP
MRKEVFVCDRCGQKKRLDITKRHWCDACTGRIETEMRPVRVKPAAGASSMN